MRLLFLLFMLISLTSFGQIRDTNLTGIQLDDEVIFLKVLNEFTHETRKRGIFIDHYISQDLGGIKILTIEEIKAIDQRPEPKRNAAGITYYLFSDDIMGYWHTTPMIGIREDMMDRGYRLIKVIIYHELGHFFGLKHLDEVELNSFGLHVMCPVLTKEFTTTEISDENMEDFWQRLKEVHPSKRRMRGSSNQ